MRICSKIQFILSISTFLLFANITHAQAVKVTPNLLNHKDWSFVENKGQLADEHGNLLPDIKYYGHQGGVSLYCKSGMLSFVFTKANAHKKLIDPLHQTFHKELTHENDTLEAARMELELLGSNLNAEIIPDGRQSATTNYFLAHTGEKGIKDVNGFKKLTYKNIYLHIDMILDAKEQGMEYSFVVHPGGNIGDIRLKWNGVDKEELAEHMMDNGKRYSNALGYLEESGPSGYAYFENIPGIRYVDCDFIKNDNILSFNVPEYDKNRNFIIDPKLEWGTYFGGSGSYDQGYGVATDAAGNIFITGYTSGSTGIATKGAYQTSLSNGGTNAFLAKFNTNGNVSWSTYYGGDGVEDVLAITTDVFGNIFIAGTTNSSIGIATSGAFQTSKAHAFLTKFDRYGSMIWGSYFGGNESAEGLCTDASGNIYMTGQTAGTKNISTSGAYQTSSGGHIDAFLAKFTNSGSLKWATYFGADYDEVGQGVCVDPFGHVYITGYSSNLNGYSGSGNIATSGTYQSSFAGVSDAFLAKFSDKGNFVWATYLGGSGNDAGKCVCSDSTADIYLAGSTNSSSGIATSIAYKTSLSGSNDVVVAKFSSAGALYWSTYYGGTNDDQAYGLALDQHGNVFVAGPTQSSNGIVTSGAYLSTFSGSRKAFLARFNKNGFLNYGTYYGGSNDNLCFGLAADFSGNAYIEGTTLSTNGIATSGAYLSSFVGSRDVFLAKFSFQKVYKYDAGIDSIINPSGDICVGKQAVKVRLHNIGSAILTSVKIAWSINRKPQPTYSWKGKVDSGATTYVILDSGFSFTSGNDTIVAYTYQPDGFTDSVHINDTARLYFTVNPLPIPRIGSKKTICKGDSTTLGDSSLKTHTYSWASYPSGFSSDSSSPVVSPAVTTTYYLTETITATGCSNTDSVKVIVNPLPLKGVSQDQPICLGQSTNIGQKPVGGYNYSWTSNPPGFTSSSADPVVGPTVNTIYKLTETITVTGCKRMDSIKVTVNPLPKATAGPAQSICFGKNTKIGDPVITGHTYSWVSSPTGFSSTLANPDISPSINTTYHLTETITATGCSKSDSVQIKINPLPKPTAGKPHTICAGTTISLGDTAQKGHSYSWASKPYGFNTNTAQTNVNPEVNTIYYLTDTLLATGCTATDSVLIKVNPSPPRHVGLGWTVCSGDTVHLNALTSKEYTYSWASVPAGLSSTDSDLVLAPSQSTTYYLTESIPSTGCSSTYTISISVDPLYTSFIGYSRAICIGSSTTIGANPVADHFYSWTSKPVGFTSTQSKITVSPKVTTTYYLLEYLTTGCRRKDSVTVTVNPLPNAKWHMDKFSRVFNFHAMDSSLSNQSYTWTIDDNHTDKGHFVKHVYDQNGIYKVSLVTVDNNGCINEFDSTLDITAYPFDSIAVYPNPFRDNLSAEYWISKSTDINVALYNIIGQQIGFFPQGRKDPGHYNIHINTYGLSIAPGYYLLEFMEDDRLVTKMLLKLQ